MLQRTIWRTFLSGFAAVLALAGCSAPTPPVAVETSLGADAAVPVTVDQAPIAPGETSPGEKFYPLDIGNHWTLARTARVQVLPDVGPPPPPFEDTSTLEIDHLGVEEHAGREYVIERYRTIAGGNTFDNQSLVRQDRGGLFEADVAPVADLVRVRGAASRDRFSRHGELIAALDGSIDRAARSSVLRAIERHDRIVDHAAGGPHRGPFAGELVALLYPLRPGRSWHYREDPLVVYTVEGADALRLAPGTFAGWRLRVELPDFFGPGDRVRVWIGRAGYLRIVSHTESDLTDPGGQVIGRVVVDEEQVLTELDLVGSPAN